MGFIDNAGDMILDAVLTDAGRERLARGDGSFKIVKFALSDDEINYGAYNKDHPSGSAYFDLEILQSPVLEAFTNNASSMNSKLVSIPRTNLLFLPVLKANEVQPSSKKHSDGAWVVAVDSDTYDDLQIDDGIIAGEDVKNGGSYLRVDQGLDTDQISPKRPIGNDLLETQYQIRIDNRFGEIVDRNSGKTAGLGNIDDDDIATYFVNLGTDRNIVKRNSNTKEDDAREVITGPRGTIVEFSVQSSLELNTSAYLFGLVGNTGTMTDKNGSSMNIYYIDSTVRVEGIQTGIKIDLPIRFIRKQ